MRLHTKIVATTVAAAALMAGNVTATAAIPGNTVLTGDSVVANPTLPDFLQNKAKAKANTGVGCVTDGSIADEIANASGGTHVDQYQCAGASFATGGIHIDDALRTAAHRGDLNPQTKNVVIVAGANDTYPYGSDVAASERAIRAGLRNAINVAHHHAPNAKVIVVGYPHVSFNSVYCYNSGLGSSNPLPVPAASIEQTEQRVQKTLREVAQQNNATFLDAWPMSLGHEACSPDRWWVNLVDIMPPAPGNLPLHLNANGTHAYGQLIGHNIVH